mgnify:CR=1 FL=1
MKGGEKMRTILEIILVVILIKSLIQWYVYYASTSGLISYISEKYGEMIDEKKAREITVSAGTKIVKDFLRLK